MNAASNGVNAEPKPAAAKRDGAKSVGAKPSAKSVGAKPAAKSVGAKPAAANPADAKRVVGGEAFLVWCEAFLVWCEAFLVWCEAIETTRVRGCGRPASARGVWPASARAPKKEGGVWQAARAMRSIRLEAREELVGETLGEKLGEEPCEGVDEGVGEGAPSPLV